MSISTADIKSVLVARIARWLGLSDPCGQGHVWTPIEALSPALFVRRCARCGLMMSAESSETLVTETKKKDSP